ncbi:MAG: IS21 family transposase [bacterium]
MAKERIGMRKIKEVLRLKFENGLSMNSAATCCSLGRTTAQEYFRRFRAAGLTWPLAEEMTDEAIEKRLFPDIVPGKSGKEPLNYEYLTEEMRQPNVTLAVLWEEYKKDRPDGYQYSQFCQLYRNYCKTLNYSMRQEHKGGAKTFADFGDGIKLVNQNTGEPIPTKLFISVWGASSLTFAKACVGEESLANWIDGSISAFEYAGCCSKALVPDNPKAVVSRACRYEPQLNPTYAEFANHYNIAVFPARPNHPKDKAKAENGVRLGKRYILAKLRKRVFYDVNVLNLAILELLEQLNSKEMKRLKKSRKQLFEILDKPNALPLPKERYEFADWKRVRVNIDYHVCFDDHYYSVPYTLIRQELEIRASRNVIEVYRKGQRVCSHKRSYRQHGYSTKAEHMPEAHRQHLEWTPGRIREWAAKSGPAVKELVDKIIQAHRFPEQAYRSCLGVIRLAERYEPGRLNKACARALLYRVETYQGVKNILARDLDKADEEANQPLSRPIQHENIRGPGYYLTPQTLPVTVS